MTDLETLAFARQIIVAHNGHVRRLKEATALLERCADEMNYDEFDDPAQRALQHDVSAFLAYRAPAQPAAPTPIGTPEQRFQEWAETHPDNPLRREPAAPEPSAELEMQRAACLIPRMPMVNPAAPGALSAVTRWVKRAEAAEARLAAARTAAVIGLAATGDSRFAVLRDMLTPAPSPGAVGGK